MLVCGCGSWMQTDGVDEFPEDHAAGRWFVRLVCRGCGFRAGIETAPTEALQFIDHRVWTDDARHALDRMPPYLGTLYQAEVEDYARSAGTKVVTWDVLNRARHGGAMAWDPDAEQRLQNVPAPVRAMAKLELERTAAEKGLSRVTVPLMEEVKARYFGLGKI